MERKASPVRGRERTKSVTKFRAVYWDLGGVLLRTTDRSRRREWESRLGLDEGKLDEAVFACSASRRATLGQATAQDVWQEVQTRFQLSASQIQALAHDFFADDRVDRQMLDVLRQLRPFYRIGMISNAWPDARRMLDKQLQISSYFDAVITSAEVGYAKPHPHIYRQGLQALGLAAEECIFVDDFVENLAGAQALGMTTIHFVSPDQALSDLSLLLA
jgi:putative hydrolase of the HAD superfamily